MKRNDQLAPRDTLGTGMYWLAVGALALSPTQLTLPRLPISASEILLALAALLWAVRWLKLRDTGNLPPFANWLFVLTGLCSVVGLLTDLMPQPGATTSFAKDTAQTVLYLLIGVTVFRAAFSTRQRIRTAVICLLAMTALAVSLGSFQRLQLQRQYQPDPQKRVVFVHPTKKAYLTSETPIQVNSTFASWDEHGYHPSRTAYAGFLALALPFALALLSTAKRNKGMMAWLALLFLGSGVSILAGYLMPAILLGLLVTGVALGSRFGRWTLVSLAAFLLVINVVGGYNRTEILHEPFQMRISSVEAHYRYNGVRHLKKFWGEQIAALNLARMHPLFGVGSGQYHKVNDAYDTFGEVTNQRLEPDAQNGYLLALVNTGMLGLAALVALYGAYLGIAWQKFRANRGNPWAAAVLGSLVALIVMTLATNPWVRGSSTVIAALMGMTLSDATGRLLERIKD